MGAGGGAKTEQFSSLAADVQPVKIGPVQPEPGENGELVVVFSSKAITALATPPSTNQPADPQGYAYDIVDTEKCVGNDLALDLDPNGRPHLRYYNACESVDIGGRGKYSSIATNSWARPHFTYADENADNLRPAWQRRRFPALQFRCGDGRLRHR